MIKSLILMTWLQGKEKLVINHCSFTIKGKDTCPETLQLSQSQLLILWSMVDLMPRRFFSKQ